ncbi:hypothetical protein MNBD_NITROSPINAE02-1448 [hydrothermal vent metagenome]|uniref:STAS domain-containing protein n=1 Tax=hydrothermal vent metagenome TaxID=652676 RepID=A0A3B1C282_9ZZZZ
MLVTKFETGEGIIILRLGGKLVASTLDNFKATIDTALSGKKSFILLNLKEVKAMDNFVVGLLLSRRKSVEGQKGMFVFCEAPLAMEAILKQAAQEKPPRIYKTEGEAIEAMHSGMKLEVKAR